jgi:hypothetical protein
MLEYPSIINSSKAPRSPCIAFNKLDGSNLRLKWNRKNGIVLFGTRTQLFDESHPIFGEAINLIKDKYGKFLNEYFLSKDFQNARECQAFFEFFGPNSFAGNHDPNDKKDVVLLDILIGHKERYFILPQDFVKLGKYVQIPEIIYEGNLNDEFIKDVREGKYPVYEGVVCKGREKSGAFMGKQWMCKIKTNKYLEDLKTKFGEKEALKYGE